MQITDKEIIDELRVQLEKANMRIIDLEMQIRSIQKASRFSNIAPYSNDIVDGKIRSPFAQ